MSGTSLPLSLYSPSIINEDLVIFPGIPNLRHFRIMGHLFFRMSFNLGFSNVATWLDSGYAIFGSNAIEWCCGLPTTYYQATNDFRLYYYWWCSLWSFDWHGIYQISLLKSYCFFLCHQYFSECTLVYSDSHQPFYFFILFTSVDLVSSLIHQVIIYYYPYLVWC